jgi:DNA-binding transcriptional MerR regulator
MLISELSKKTGLSKDTIRFYEKIGLVHVPPAARRNNNYKEYSDVILQKLLVIKEIRGFDFTLEEIQDIIALYESDSRSCSKNAPLLIKHLERIDQTIRHLTAVQKKLRSTVSCCSGQCSETCGLEKNLRKLFVVPKN